VEFTSPYKGGTRVWSNRFHFSGGLPANSTAWGTLATAVGNSYKPAMRAGSVITRWTGYAAGSDVPVYDAAVSIAGTISPGANDRGCPLGVAAVIRWTTSARSTKNHPIYLFSYVHDVMYDATVSGNDKLASDQKTALTTFANAWVSGFSDGSHTLVRTSPAGHDATGALVEEYLTHRDFPYQTSV
jgi:hypothetical protein